MQDRRHHAPDGSSNIPSGLPAELDLLLACARWPQRRKEDRQLVRRKCAAPINWQRFLQLVQHHRLVPLVTHNLQASLDEPVSPEFAVALTELRRLSTLSAHQALYSLSELRRVVKALESKQIGVRVLKGLPLAQSIFGDLSLRASGDLDLLIDESNIVETDRILRQFGYTGLFKLDRLSPKRLDFYRAHWKDLTYQNPQTGFEVDLHWRCFRNSKMPGATLCAAGEHETVVFGGFQVSTPPRLQSLLYLCVHGTLDGWLYFKSLVDVAVQVRMMDAGQLDALAGAATEYAILPELSATLILIRRYFGMNYSSELLLPATDPTVRHILRYAEQTVELTEYLADRDRIPIATTLSFEMGLRRNFAYRMELLLRVLFRARMWETIPLPDYLFGIYPLLSPLEWAIYRLRAWWSKSGATTELAI